MKTPEQWADEVMERWFPGARSEMPNYKVEEDIAQAIREAVKEAAPRWIPVGERLPDEMRDVLVWTGNEMSMGHFYNGKWWADEESWWADQTLITHWMPYPPPPEVQS